MACLLRRGRGVSLSSRRTPAASERRTVAFHLQVGGGDARCALGIGATVGSVIPTKGAIIPAAVGADIGCGMMAVQTSLHANHLPGDMLGIRMAIERAVPHDRTDNGGKSDRGAWHDAPAPIISTCGPRRHEGAAARHISSAH